MNWIRASARTLLLSSLLIIAARSGGGTFRVASYNVENYLDVATETRGVKPAESRARVCESILQIKPDVLGLQEMGAVSALSELQASLKEKGLDLPHMEHVSGFDTNVHVAVLSRFPFSARRPHTNDSFLLSGRRFRVGRGFAEVDIRVNPEFTFTLMVTHLKSKRAVPEADEAELRLEEAKILREKIDARFERDSAAKLIVLGDFNDTKDSPSTRAVVGRGKYKLVDTRPAERNGDNLPSTNPAYEPRNITWTHFYGKEDAYTRIDFLLASPAMARRWVTNETYVLSTANWGQASDHRPVVATFNTE